MASLRLQTQDEQEDQSGSGTSTAIHPKDEGRGKNKIVGPIILALIKRTFHQVQKHRERRFSKQLNQWLTEKARMLESSASQEVRTPPQTPGPQRSLDEGQRLVKIGKGFSLLRISVPGLSRGQSSRRADMQQPRAKGLLPGGTAGEKTENAGSKILPDPSCQQTSVR